MMTIGNAACCAMILARMLIIHHPQLESANVIVSDAVLALCVSIVTSTFKAKAGFASTALKKRMS